MEINNIKMGRIEIVDERDSEYPVGKILDKLPYIPQKYWWAEGWWGDQGSTSKCVAYSWMHWVEDGPVIQDTMMNRPYPLLPTYQFYKECQKRDYWKGDNYEGTSVRAGAKILKELGVIDNYYWAKSIDDIVSVLTTLGPMVVGTKWYYNMFTPNNKGIIRVGGKDAGGHAYIINGVDVDNQYFRIKNSWGLDWGTRGHGFISFDDFEKLLKDGGEACYGIENKMQHIPLLESLTPVYD